MEPERTVIGLDVGGTKVAAAVVRGRTTGAEARTSTGGETPRIVSSFAAPTDKSSAQACLDGLMACVARAVAEAGAVDAIGVGTASMVDYAAGRIVRSVNLPLSDVPLRELLATRFGVPVAVDNDATAACLAEHACGAGAGTRDMLMLTLGTGVGGGIICDGHPYRGHSGSAGELGHVMIDLDGPKCPAGCPTAGVWRPTSPAPP